MSPDLASKFDEAIAEDSGDDPHPDCWRFSSLGKCPRAQVLARMGHPRTPFDVKTKILLRIGHLVEEQAISWLATKVDIIARQVTVEARGWDAVGHTDALIRIDNEIAVLEVKSTRDRGVEYAPYENHVLQATAYAIFLGLPRSFLLYVGRDGARKFVECRPSLELERKIKNEWSLLQGYYLAGLVPNKLAWVQATRKVNGKEVPWVYERSGPWGEEGQAKMEPPKVSGYCAYRGTGLCCGDSQGESDGGHREEAGSDTKVLEQPEGQTSES